MTDMDRDTRAGQQGNSDDIRQRAVEAYDQARDKAVEAYDQARDRAWSARRKATDTLKEAPLVALGAGIAAGALIAALLPSSRREREFLKPYGTKMTGAARDAADAARKVGSEKLQELGLMPDALLDKAQEAVKTSAQAAVGTFRDDVIGGQTNESGTGAKPRKSGTQSAGSTRSSQA
jgi:ElaB/YqjD/DUF883 family membrane-anchored ribosome-binding protein